MASESIPFALTCMTGGLTDEEAETLEYLAETLGESPLDSAVRLGLVSDEAYWDDSVLQSAIEAHAAEGRDFMAVIFNAAHANRVLGDDPSDLFAI